MGYYYYCINCTKQHDVDVLYSYYSPYKSFTAVHLGFSFGKKYKMRVSVSPFSQAMHVTSFPDLNKYILDYAIIEGKLRRIVHPHVHIDKNVKIFELPWKYVFTPENVKQKIKTLITFS